MSGKDEGVQQHLTAAGADKSTYFHCFAHKLNLVLEKSVNNVPSVNDVFDIVGCVYLYLEGSPKRHALYEGELQVHGISKGKIALHALSDTRWTARSDNLEVVFNTLPAIISMLETMPEEGESAADGLLERVQKLRFIASCIVLKNCFALSRSLSEYLQHENMDLVSAVSGVQSLKDSLSSFPNEEKMDQFLLEEREYCTDKGFVVNDFDPVDHENSNRPKRRRTIPSYFNDSEFVLDQDARVIQEEIPCNDSPRDLFKRDFFSPFLDWMHNELERRFCSKACEMLSLANVFHPRYFEEENSSQAQQLAKLFGIDPDVVGNQFVRFSKSREIKVWKQKYEEFLKVKEKADNDSLTKTPETWLCLPTLLKVFGENLISNRYPDLFDVIKIVATLPSTVASCERAHSKVKIIKNSSCVDAR